jgi:hypothetical protein
VLVVFAAFTEVLCGIKSLKNFGKYLRRLWRQFFVVAMEVIVINKNKVLPGLNVYSLNCTPGIESTKPRSQDRDSKRPGCLARES